MTDPQPSTADRCTADPSPDSGLDTTPTPAPAATTPTAPTPNATLAARARSAMPVTARVDPVLRVQTNLTARDHTIIAWLGDHGVLTTDQVAFALFPTLDVAQRRLRVLTELGLLQRFRTLRPDGGSYPFHYVLDHLGALVLAVQTGADPPRPAQSRARMQALTRRPDLSHLLGINQFFTDLAGYARTHPGAALHRWWSTTRCARYGVFATNPDDALSYRAPIRPDGHGVFTDHRADHPDHSDGTGMATVSFFLEHDTGTEPLATLAGKINGYQRMSWQTGHRWPVLFWLHSSTRERHLHDHLAAGVPPGIPIATAARDRTHAQNPAEAIWRLHNHADDADTAAPRLRLADLPATPPTPDSPRGRDTARSSSAGEVIP